MSLSRRLLVPTLLVAAAVLGACADVAAPGASTSGLDPYTGGRSNALSVDRSLIDDGDPPPPPLDTLSSATFSEDPLLALTASSLEDASAGPWTMYFRSTYFSQKPLFKGWIAFNEHNQPEGTTVQGSGRV